MGWSIDTSAPPPQKKKKTQKNKQLTPYAVWGKKLYRAPAFSPIRAVLELLEVIVYIVKAPPEK